jgi:hypothetical protein
MTVTLTSATCQVLVSQPFLTERSIIFGENLKYPSAIHLVSGLSGLVSIYDLIR